MSKLWESDVSSRIYVSGSLEKIVYPLREHEIINTVHEDDITAWYQLPDSVEEISLSYFELDEDFPVGDLDIFPQDLTRCSAAPGRGDN